MANETYIVNNFFSRQLYIFYVDLMYAHEIIVCANGKTIGNENKYIKYA